LLTLICFSDYTLSNLVFQNEYDVTWNSPSTSSEDSMPIGNGDLAANIWVTNGRLHILLAKSDAWSEESRLLKLGKIILSFDPDIFPREPTPSSDFRQRLRLKDATVHFTGKYGSSIHVWIDALANLLKIEVNTSRLAVKVTSELVIWRDRLRNFLPGEETSFMGATCRTRLSYPDTVIPSDAEGNLVWYHRNENRSIFAEELLHERLDPSFIAGLYDPLLNRTFGCLLRGKSAMDDGTFTSYSVSGSHIATSRGASLQHVVEVIAHTDVSASVGDWRAGLAARAEDATESAGWAREAHAAWWAAFWQRSHVSLAGVSDAAVVSRGYCVERYLQACGGRGEQPLKFNGNLFTVEGRGFDADFRQWGGMYWFQNTRLPYWGMLASGDADLMGPLLRTYADALPVLEARAAAWWGHAGAAVPEIMHWWGGLGDEVR
jgi:alpha-L-fucosidase 2